MKNKAGIYIHFPFCKIKCGYCDFYSITDKEDSIPLFIDSLLKEIEIYFSSKNSTSELSFDTIFLGGGTPSLIPSKYIERIFSTLSKYINLSNVKEITIEANPGESPKDRLREYRELGINRISFGFQALNNDLLKFLDRLHKKEDCFNAYQDARDAGFKNINTDMIFNIPGQSLDTLNDNIDRVIDMKPEHISCYSLTVEKGTMLYHNVSNNIVKMPDEKLDHDMYLSITSKMKDAGYTQYEVSNYCKNNMKCIHNLHYWNLDSYLAFGPSAHGYDGRKRWWNHRSLDKYVCDIKNNKLPIQNSEILSKEDRYNEIIMNGLRTTQGVNVDMLKSLKLQSNYSKAINKWSDLIIDNNFLKLKNNNFMLLDEITADLFLQK